jgi:hypothetical protein
MPGKERSPIENGPIPDWAEKERTGDLFWIMANLHVLWPAAQNAYATKGRGALVVDLTTRLGTGHPFFYATKANVVEYDDPDALRMVNQYNPKLELVIILFKSEERTSTYRLQPPYP